MCSHNNIAGLEQKINELEITLTFPPSTVEGKQEQLSTSNSKAHKETKWLLTTQCNAEMNILWRTDWLNLDLKLHCSSNSLLNKKM